jgi:hypothetical protein
MQQPPRISLLVFSLVIAGIVFGNLLSNLSASPSPVFPPGGDCGPSDVANSSSGALCGTTSIYCGGTHLSGDCQNQPSNCEHVNIIARADGCPHALHGSIFSSGTDSTTITGTWGPWLLYLGSVSPKCGDYATKTATFKDGNDPTIQLGQKLVDFKCDPCE